MAAKRTKSIAEQIAAEDRKLGEEYTFPGTSFTVRIKPVGSHTMLMGGVVPDGYSVKKYRKAITGQIEDPTAEDVETLNATVMEVIKEAVRMGWPAQYDDFVELMLPRLTQSHIQGLFRHLMEMEGLIPQDMFPEATDESPA